SCSLGLLGFGDAARNRGRTVRRRAWQDRPMAAHDTPPRIDPVDPDDATPAQAELLDQLRVDAGSNLFHTYANHPKLMKAWMRFGGRLLLRSAFDPRTRELIILRAAVVCGSHYEWGQHVGIARDAGLD